MGRDAGRESLDDLLERANAQPGASVCLKNDKGLYTYSNDLWSELATVPIHKLTGKSDFQLPWGARNGNLIISMDKTTRKVGALQRVDRLVHFDRREWMHTVTERLYLDDQRLILCVVTPTKTDDFCRLANLVTDKGITCNGISLSIKQLYLLHQLLFQVPQKLVAREYGISVNRIHQYLRNIREEFGVEDNKELLCLLSAAGLFPLLERFDQIFKFKWVHPELRFR